MCSHLLMLLFILRSIKINAGAYQTNHFDRENKIEVIDLTRPTSWRDMSEYYGAVEKNWKICLNCGTPSLGTCMHMERPGTSSAMHPAVIPAEYLITRLSIIDVSSMTRLDPTMVLSVDVALQWISLKHDPSEPTVFLFKFGWDEEDNRKMLRSCVCKIPGISYELASWIATNLTHVVGVATDAPTLESEQTREFTSRTVSNLLGKSGIYMIENVNMKRSLPEQGCLAVVTPLKMSNANFVPASLLAFCPAERTHKRVIISLNEVGRLQQTMNSRLYDVNLEEILNHK